MRVKELVHPKHRHRMQQFVKTNIEVYRKVKKKTDQANAPVPVNKPAAMEEQAKRKLPLFMETVFKAKDFDPL
jgi:hypothetical protein